MALVEALQGFGSPAERVVLLTRPENHDRFAAMAGPNTRAVLLDRPAFAGETGSSWEAMIAAHGSDGRRAMAAYQAKKTAAILTSGADVVHFPGNVINPLDLGVPAVLNLHEVEYRRSPQFYTANELADRNEWWTASAHRADAIVAADVVARDDLVAEIGVDRRKLFVASTPVEAAYAAPWSAERLADLTSRFALPATFFLYPAAVAPHKNHDALIRAFLAADLPGAQLLLTGGGQVGSHLSRLVRDGHAGSRVRLLGRVDTADLAGLYRLATATVLPQRFGTWSRAAAEAMACGCPIACSNTPGLVGQVGDAGLTFGPDDGTTLAGAMRALATNVDLRATLAGHGLARAAAAAVGSFASTLATAYAHAQLKARTRRAA